MTLPPLPHLPPIPRESELRDWATSYAEQYGRLCAEASAAELDRLQARVAELEALLHRIEPHIDSIVCYASTMGEHEPNRIAHDLRAAIDTARKAKP